jgi:predicted RNA binding protein YcfA (HicA-like mRNA interferase family)
MMDKRKEMILGILDKLGIHFVITKGSHRTLLEYRDFEETLILGGRCLSEYLK